MIARVVTFGPDDGTSRRVVERALEWREIVVGATVASLMIGFDSNLDNGSAEIGYNIQFGGGAARWHGPNALILAPGAEVWASIGSPILGVLQTSLPNRPVPPNALPRVRRMSIGTTATEAVSPANYWRRIWLTNITDSSIVYVGFGRDEIGGTNGLPIARSANRHNRPFEFFVPPGTRVFALSDSATGEISYAIAPVGALAGLTPSTPLPGRFY